MNPKLDSLKNLFQLDSNITYLNHGSFGACPVPIYNERAKWQLELEKQPVRFIERRVFDLVDKSRENLAKYINCHKDDIVFFPNPTTALNMVIRSLKLNKDEHVITTDHEYGALDRTWKFISNKRGFNYTKVNVSLPIDEDAIIQSFKNKINNKTRVIFLSHITSPTGLILPIKRICELAKNYNIIIIIDGAHVPGHIELDLEDLGVDVFTGACHKWMMCPKGVSFLYASKKIQPILEPLVVSWGWESENPTHSQFLDYHQYQGTNDPSSYISVSKAIEFMEEYRWGEVRDYCHDMVVKSREILLETTGTQSICKPELLGQMASIQVNVPDPINLYKYFISKNIEIPVINWGDKVFIRVSFQCYNSMEDIELLNNYLKKYLDGI